VLRPQSEAEAGGPPSDRRVVSRGDLCRHREKRDDVSLRDVDSFGNGTSQQACPATKATRDCITARPAAPPPLSHPSFSRPD